LANDDYLDTASIHGEEAEVDSKGAFHHRVVMKKGDSSIIVLATDKAGNKERKTFTFQSNRLLCRLKFIMSKGKL
jgi:bacillopeptidase F